MQVIRTTGESCCYGPLRTAFRTRRQRNPCPSYNTGKHSKKGRYGLIQRYGQQTAALQTNSCPLLPMTERNRVPSFRQSHLRSSGLEDVRHARLLRAVEHLGCDAPVFPGRCRNDDRFAPGDARRNGQHERSGRKDCGTPRDVETDTVDRSGDSSALHALRNEKTLVLFLWGVWDSILTWRLGSSANVHPLNAMSCVRREHVYDLLSEPRTVGPKVDSSTRKKCEDIVK